MKDSDAEFWQVDILVDGVHHSIAQSGLTRADAVSNAAEHNQNLGPLLVMNDWMPLVVAVAVKEDPARRVAREVIEDLDALTMRPRPTSIETHPIGQPVTAEYVAGRRAKFVNEHVGSRSKWEGYILSASDEPTAQVRLDSGATVFLPLRFITEVSERYNPDGTR